MKACDRQLLLDAAQCLDDCVMLIYPEDFAPELVEQAKVRFAKSGGIIGRTCDLAEGLRKNTKLTGGLPAKED